MASRRNKRRNPRAASVLLIVIAFLAVMSVQIYKIKQKDAEYKIKEEEARMAYEAETERASEIDELAHYMESDEYYVDMGHSKLGLAFENETIYKQKSDGE